MKHAMFQLQVLHFRHNPLFLLSDMFNAGTGGLGQGLGGGGGDGWGMEVNTRLIFHSFTGN